jgi:hypothetical protein
MSNVLSEEKKQQVIALGELPTSELMARLALRGSTSGLPVTRSWIRSNLNFRILNSIGADGPAPLVAILIYAAVWADGSEIFSYERRSPG